MARVLFIKLKGGMTMCSRFDFRHYTVFILLLFFLWGCGDCDCEKETDLLSPLKVSQRDQKEMVLVHPGGDKVSRGASIQSIEALLHSKAGRS